MRRALAVATLLCALSNPAIAQDPDPRVIRFWTVHEAPLAPCSLTQQEDGDWRYAREPSLAGLSCDQLRALVAAAQEPYRRPGDLRVDLCLAFDPCAQAPVSSEKR